MALHEQAAFSGNAESGFYLALTELEDIGYPGVTDPKLTITTSINPIDGLNHASAAQYEVPTPGGGRWRIRASTSGGLERAWLIRTWCRSSLP